MTYTASTRDRYRLAVLTTTASVAAGAIAATGWAAGAAARDQAETDAAQQAEQDARANAEYAAWQEQYGTQAVTRKPRTIVRQRPTRTRVSMRYVTATSPVAAVGPGGTVSTPTTASTSSGQTQHDQLLGRRGRRRRRRRAVLDAPAPAPAAAHADQRILTVAATSTTFRALGTSTFVAVRDPYELDAARTSGRHRSSATSTRCAAGSARTRTSPA